MFDLHCHVDLIDPMDKFCAATRALDVSLLAMTTTPRAYSVEAHMLSRYPSVHVALGMHPQLVSERKHELAIFDRYVDSSRFIGEVGLDFSKRFYHSKVEQISVFEHIIQSCAHSKTISIHAVFSDKYVLDILERYAATEYNECIFHWYSGSLNQLDRAIEMGCFFSINEQMLRSSNGIKIVERIPISRMVLESDAPFVGNIKTGMLLKSSLERTVVGLNRIKLDNTMDEIDKTSRKLLGK